ncbi:hypothetical protein LCGC14_1816860, partial [marine sediment metagenome]
FLLVLRYLGVAIALAEALERYQDCRITPELITLSVDFVATALDATQDGKITDEEPSRLMKAHWALIHGAANAQNRR